MIEMHGIEATMTRHRASLHKTCCLKFNQTKLDRLGKKFLRETDSLGMQTRSSHSKVDLKEATCLFCDNSAYSQGLHNASTYDINRKVCQCALEFNDTALLAKLSPGDKVAQISYQMLSSTVQQSQSSNQQYIWQWQS